MYRDADNFYQGNPGTGAPRNIGPGYAPYGNYISGVATHNWNALPRRDVRQIQPNYNMGYGMPARNTSYGRYQGQRGNNAYRHGRQGTSNSNRVQRDSVNVLNRAVMDANAGYQDWTQREVEQIRRAARNNPEYARRLVQNYRNTGSFLG